jgi:hypothetical protein
VAVEVVVDGTVVVGTVVVEAVVEVDLVDGAVVVVVVVAVPELHAVTTSTMPTSNRFIRAWTPRTA